MQETPLIFKTQAWLAPNLASMKLDWIAALMLLGRICLSAIFLISGVGKLMAPGAAVTEIQAVGLPLPQVGVALAIAIELGCGVALLFGFKLRWTAAILAVFSVATAVFFHSSFGDPNQFTHFLKNVAIAGGLLHVMVSRR